MRKVKLSLISAIIIEKINTKTPLEVFNNQLMNAMRDLNNKFNWGFTTSSIIKGKQK